MITQEILLLLALMILNGFLAMARSALINVRKARLKQLIDEGVGSARTAEGTGRARSVLRVRQAAVGPDVAIG